MASVIRNTLSGPSRLLGATRILTARPVAISYLPPLSRPFSTSPRHLAPTPTGANSAQASSSSSSTSSRSGSGAPPPGSGSVPGFKFDIPSARKARNADPDAWWKALSRPRESGFVNTKFTSRSVPVRGVGKVRPAMRSLDRLIKQTNMKKHFRNQEYFEPPTAKRRRLRTQRHMRRFAAMVREKVKEVNLFTQRK
ncbi:hypothetical protein BD324DRAFT_649647 [Kockovaella imperatae]|uniref:Uncharacterized protein n=1 Tax=Kockovaella imperatae TaxID=4999 RepID=A0A1Y1UJM7_9TREE|nr:hypothetical protein BD324DRAFT_649647 [Kockovaella imperatae]ORX38270.1 hypothetical protein BD324DRAFT_649647 [Kockovaella imperatae]